MNYLKLLPWVTTGILGVILFFSVKGCNDNAELASDYKAERDFANTQVSQFSNKLDQIISEQKVQEVNNKEVIKELSSQIFQLTKAEEKRIKEVQTLVRIIQKAGLDTVFVPYSDTITVNDTGMIRRDSVVIPPRNFKDSTANYDISGTVLLNGVRINSLSISDTLSFRVAEKRPKGLVRRIFQPNETVIQSVHSNPLIKTSGIQSMTLKHKNNAWNRWIKPAIAIGAGVFLGSKLR